MCFDAVSAVARNSNSLLMAEWESSFEPEIDPALPPLMNIAEIGRNPLPIATNDTETIMVANYVLSKYQCTHE